MLDVNVSINGAILYCDESVLGLQLGRGYSIVKTYIDDLPFKEKITDGRGQLTISYFSSVMSDEHGNFLICLKKDAVHQISNPLTGPGVYTDDDLRCDNQIENYNRAESDYLHMVFSLLRLYKEGNIGTKQVFFDHSFSMGILKNNLHLTSDNVTRNITDERVFSLSPAEVLACNQFVADYVGAPYGLMKDNIDEFVWGLAQVDLATGFEQYTTALEMTLLGHNQQGKKEVLSKRIAVMLETAPANIDNLYKKMKDFYRYRSESLHEGNGQNISDIELIEMEGVVRRVLIKCLERCKTELAANPLITWQEIKNKLIDDLKTQVTAEAAAGRFVS